MDKLLLLGAVAFVAIFGGLIVERVLTLCFNLFDKTIENIGKLLMSPFKLSIFLLKIKAKIVIKAAQFLATVIFTLLKKNRQESARITPVFDVSPLHLQQMRQSRYLAQERRQPVIIEHPPLT